MSEFPRRLSRSEVADLFRRPALTRGQALFLFAAALLASLLFGTNFLSFESDRLISEATSGAAVGTTGLESADLVFVQARRVSPVGTTQRFPEGSRLVRLAPGQPQGVRDLTPDFFAVSDPQVSFDGSKVLFAGKTASDSRWQVWEMGIDGSAKRQVTHCEGDCLRPAYMARDQIVYTVIPPGGPSSTSGSQLYVSANDGSEAHAITFGPGDFQVEAVLQDGRILASARDPLRPASSDSGAGKARQTRELYTLRPDGTALASFRCDHHPGVSRGEATELDDGSVVFLKTRLGGQTGGELAVFRKGAPHNSPLAPMAEVYRSPRRGNDDGLIVAKQRRTSGGPAGERFDLYAFDVAHGHADEALFADPTFSSLDAVPVASHPQPRWYWSILNPQVKVGYFVCLDSRVSMDAPGGRFPAKIAKVRVLTLDITPNGAPGSERVLGEAPVESDGSFYIAIPPDQPVRFETLDAGGKLVHAQRSWIWSRSGEERGCLGCHDDKAVAAENTWPLALKRLDSPTRLGVESAGNTH